MVSAVMVSRAPELGPAWLAERGVGLPAWGVRARSTWQVRPPDGGPGFL